MYLKRRGLYCMVIATAGILVAVICLGQQKPATKSSVADLLMQLHSGEWKDRVQAFEQLRSNSKALGTQEVQEGLLELLDRENQLVESVDRDPQGPSVDEKYGEDYSEYLGELSDIVDSFADWNDPREVCIFIHESYNPESRFAAKIAAHGKVAIPCLTQMYGSDVELTRAEAAAVLVQALATARDQLDSATLQNVKRVILSALHDPADAVRAETVRALGKFGDADMIPALQQVAETDPAPEARGHSIRKEAAKAIAAIQGRTAQPQN